MEKIKRIKIPTHTDERGNLSVLEIRDFVPWEVKRIYYVTSVKEDRGGHAVRGEKKIYICAQGKVTARIHDGNSWREFNLEGPDDAILMDGMCYREFNDFSSGAVLLAVSNMNYEPDKYIYDFEEFLKKVNN